MLGPAFTRSGREAPNTLLATAAACVLLLAGKASAQVQVQTLAAPDLFSIGSGPSDLPGDLWRGSSASLARAVIPHIGSRPISPAAAALARHVLSAGANAPEGGGDDAELAAARAGALLTLGDALGAEVIAERTPNLSQKPALSQVAAEAALVRGQDDKACAVGDALTTGRDGAFWQRLRAYCQARAGQAAAAQLTLDLNQQPGQSPDFGRLIAAMLAGTDGGAGALDDGLDYALSRRTAPAWPAALPTASAPVIVAVAHDPMAPAAARLEAAARSARLGFPASEAYGAIATPPTDVAAANQPGAAGEAALLALAGSTSDNAIKEAAVIALLKRSADATDFQALSGLTSPAIAQLLAARTMLKEPALFAEAAAVAGDLPSARAARSLVGSAGPPPAPLDLALLDALIAAATPGQPGGETTPAIDASAGPAGAPSASRAAAAMALLAALGAPLEAQARLDIATSDLGPARLTASRRAAMEAAARAGRIGDTALYVLVAAFEGGASGPAPADRIALVQALAQAGLKSDARALAVEGLIGLQARP